MDEIKKAVFVMYQSENGRDNWTLVHPDDVPEWLKDPEVMGQLVCGHMAMKTDEGPRGSPYYRAEVVLPQGDRVRLTQALRAREQREASRVLVMPENSTIN